MKPNLTTIEGNLKACNHADARYVELKESGMSKTPRTDLFIELVQAEHVRKGLDDFDHYFDMTGALANYARKLERELTASASLDPPTKTEIYCREHKRKRFEKMLELVYGFFRRKV